MRRRAREVMSAQQSHLGAHHFLSLYRPDIV